MELVEGETGLFSLQWKLSSLKILTAAEYSYIEGLPNTVKDASIGVMFATKMRH